MADLVLVATPGSFSTGADVMHGAGTVQQHRGRMCEELEGESQAQEEMDDSQRPELSSSPIIEGHLSRDRERSVADQHRALAAGRMDPESVSPQGPPSLTRAATLGAQAPMASGQQVQTRHHANWLGGRVPRRDPNPPSRPELVAARALHDVFRSGSLSAKDKLRKIQQMCQEVDGIIVRYCLEGIGWNSRRTAQDAPFGRWEYCPNFEDAIHRLTLATSALASGDPLPSRARMEEIEVPLPAFRVACMFLADLL